MFDYKLIVASAIFASAFFAVDELLKLDHAQLNEKKKNSRLEDCLLKLTKNLFSQLKDREEKLSQCEEKLSQCKEAVN